MTIGERESGGLLLLGSRGLEGGKIAMGSSSKVLMNILGILDNK